MLLPIDDYILLSLINPGPCSDPFRDEYYFIFFEAAKF